MSPSDNIKLTHKNAVKTPIEQIKADAKTLIGEAIAGTQDDESPYFYTKEQGRKILQKAEDLQLDTEQLKDSVYSGKNKSSIEDAFYKAYRSMVRRSKTTVGTTPTPKPSPAAGPKPKKPNTANQIETPTADPREFTPIEVNTQATAEPETGEEEPDLIEDEKDIDIHSQIIHDRKYTTNARIENLKTESVKAELKTELANLETETDLKKLDAALFNLSYKINEQELKEEEQPAAEPEQIQPEQDPEIGELSIIGLDATEEETAAYFQEKSERTEYRNIPPWIRDIIPGIPEINQSVWFNDHFLQSLEIRDPANISKITTELSNGIRYAAEARNFLVYDISDKPQGKRTIPKYFWRSWTGTYWKPAVWEPQTTAKLVIKAIEKEIAYFSMQALNTKDEIDQKNLKAAAKELLRHYNESSKKNGIKHMIDLSAAEPGLSADINKIYDRNLIGCNNGIIDTKNAIFYPVSEITEDIKNRYPIHHIDCNYIVNAPKPGKFIDFLQTVFTDNTSQNVKELENRERGKQSVKVLIRLLGSILVAGNPERKMLFFYGKGRNGKSTLMGLLKDILGDEYGEGNSSELYAKAGDPPAPRITEALTRRLLSFPEMAGSSVENKFAGLIKLDVVKLLTGEISTNMFRGMGSYDGIIDILCSPIAQTNDFPQFDRTPDRAFLDRLITVPFLHRLTDEEIDPNIREKILKEKDLIFSLLVNECFTYRKGKKDSDGMLIEKPGLLTVPEYWGSEQTKIMVGPTYYEYISKRFVKSKDPNAIDFTSIKNDFINWLRLNKAEEPRPFKDELHSYDTSGDRQAAWDLKKGDKSKLKKALAIFGYEEHESNGKSYYNVNLSKETLMEWEPNPQY